MTNADLPQPGEYFDRASGQNIHCQRAFMWSSVFPYGWRARFELGFQFGAGLAAGGVFAAGVIALASNAFRAVFA